VTILENFVKSYAIKVLTGTTAEVSKPKKRRSSLLPGRKETKTQQIDYDCITNGIDLCKEVADGLRVYFNFILKDFLLYPEEKEEIEKLISKEMLENFKFDPGEQLEVRNFYSKTEPVISVPETIPENAEGSSSNTDKKPTRLRSRTEDEEKLENMSSLASTSSGDSALPEVRRKGIFSKSWFPLNSGLSTVAKKIIDETFAWKMIPSDSEAEPSMIFGIYYLTRLVVKLPEFLSATPMNEEKLTMLLKYLDLFVEFLEENTEIYGPQNYLIEDVKLEPKTEDSK
jgi:male-specific lethal 3